MGCKPESSKHFEFGLGANLAKPCTKPCWKLGTSSARRSNIKRGPVSQKPPELLTSALAMNMASVCAKGLGP